MTPIMSKRRRLGPPETCDFEIREAPVLSWSLKEQTVRSHRPCAYLTVINNLAKSFLPLSLLVLSDYKHPKREKQTLKKTKFDLSARYWLLFIYAPYLQLFSFLFLKFLYPLKSYIKLNIFSVISALKQQLDKCVFSVSAVLVWDVHPNEAAVSSVITSTGWRRAGDQGCNPRTSAIRWGPGCARIPTSWCWLWAPGWFPSWEPTG